MPTFFAGLFLFVLIASDAYAEARQFERVEEFPQGMQTDILTSAFLSGFEMSTVMEATFPAPQSLVWEAMKWASERFDKAGRRPVVTADEKNGRIQNGRISQDAVVGAGTGAWVDEVVMELTAISENQTKVSVFRRVVQTILKRRLGGFNREWRASKSNGRIESWLLTQVEDRLAALKAGQAGTIPPTKPVSGTGVESQSVSESVAEKRLIELRRLREKNLISEEEYQRHREKILEDLLKK